MASASVGALFVVALGGERKAHVSLTAISLNLDLERMARFFFIACVTLSLTGCATFRPADNELDRYVGGPVSDVAVKLGPPTAKFDLGDGHLAFDWENYGGCTYSVVATSRKAGSPSLADWKVESWKQTDACLDVKR
jgi:hypothetical protein